VNPARPQRSVPPAIICTPATAIQLAPLADCQRLAPLCPSSGTGKVTVVMGTGAAFFFSSARDQQLVEVHRKDFCGRHTSSHLQLQISRRLPRLTAPSFDGICGQSDPCRRVLGQSLRCFPALDDSGRQACGPTHRASAQCNSGWLAADTSMYQTS